MLEQTGNALPFNAFFTSLKVGLSGLTVTANVYANGTQILSDQPVVDIGGGLYRYLLPAENVTVEGEYIVIFKTDDPEPDLRQIPTLWLVNKGGVEYLNAPVGGMAQAVWDHPRRTITQSLVSIYAAMQGNNINMMRGDTLDLTITGLGNLSGYEKIYWTVKTSTKDLDTRSILQIEKSAGLLYINKKAATIAINGSLTILDEVSGDINLFLDADESALLTPAFDLYYDIQLVDANKKVLTPLTGRLNITSDVTKDYKEPEDEPAP